MDVNELVIQAKDKVAWEHSKYISWQELEQDYNKGYILIEEFLYYIDLGYKYYLKLLKEKEDEDTIIDPNICY